MEDLSDVLGALGDWRDMARDGLPREVWGDYGLTLGNPDVAALKRELKALKDGKRSAKASYERQLDAAVTAAKRAYDSAKSSKKSKLDTWEREFDRKVDALEHAIDEAEEAQAEAQQAHQLMYYVGTLEDGRSRYERSDMQKLSYTKLQALLAETTRRQDWIRRSDIKPKDSLSGKESNYLAKLVDWVSAELDSRERQRELRRNPDEEGYSTTTKVLVGAGAALAAYYLITGSMPFSSQE